MSFQEIIVGIAVLSAGFYSLRMFIRQFTRKEGGCSTCSCEPLDEKFKKASLNTPNFRKVTSQ